MEIEPLVTLPIWWLVIWLKLWAFLTPRASSLMATPLLSSAHERELSHRVPPTSPSTRANTLTGVLKISLLSWTKWSNLITDNQALPKMTAIADLLHSSWTPQMPTTLTNRRILKKWMMKLVQIATTRTIARASALLHSSYPAILITTPSRLTRQWTSIRK